MQTDNKIKLLFAGLVDVIYPAYCLICKIRINEHDSRTSPLCFGCFKKIVKNIPPFCIKCGKTMPVELNPASICLACRNEHFYFDRAWSVLRYEGIVRECIHQLKYSRRLSLVNLFGIILVEFANVFLEMKKFSYILPIPLHQTKLRERQFNQSLVLAQALAHNFKKRLLNNVCRKKFTLPQSELTSEKRKENIRAAFGITKPELIKDKNILLVDDIFTTGATVNECASLLKKNGSGIVEVLTLAS